MRTPAPSSAFTSVANLTVLLETGERLISRDRQQTRLGRIGGNPIGRLRFVPEAIQESANPLVANGDRRRKDQRRFAHAPQRFQTDYRLPGTWRRDQMKVIVIEVCIEFRQNARLVWPPRVAKLHASGKDLANLPRQTELLDHTPVYAARSSRPAHHACHMPRIALSKFCAKL